MKIALLRRQLGATEILAMNSLSETLKYLLNEFKINNSERDVTKLIS